MARRCRWPQRLRPTAALPPAGVLRSPEGLRWAGTFRPPWEGLRSAGVLAATGRASAGRCIPAAATLGPSWCFGPRRGVVFWPAGVLRPSRDCGRSPWRSGRPEQLRWNGHCGLRNAPVIAMAVAGVLRSRGRFGHQGVLATRGAPAAVMSSRPGCFGPPGGSACRGAPAAVTPRRPGCLAPDGFVRPGAPVTGVLRPAQHPSCRSALPTGAGHRGLRSPGRFGHRGTSLTVVLRAPGRFGACGVSVTGVLRLPGACSGRPVCCGLRCVPAVVMLRPARGRPVAPWGPRPAVPRWCEGSSLRRAVGPWAWRPWGPRPGVLCRVAGWPGVSAVFMFWPTGPSACAGGPVSYISLCSGRLDCHDRHHRSRPRRYG